LERGTISGVAEGLTTLVLEPLDSPAALSGTGSDR
jgi:hypothetical protein